MTDIQIKKYQGGFRVYNKYTGKWIGKPIEHMEDAIKARDFQDITSDKYEGGEHMDYGKVVGGQLGYKPSKQPVAHTEKVGDKPSQASKVRSVAGMGFTTMKQKGMPNRSYSVSVVNKAVAKMGGH